VSEPWVCRVIGAWVMGTADRENSRLGCGERNGAVQALESCFNRLVTGVQPPRYATSLLPHYPHG
jgi:hypothetical protein